MNSHAQAEIESFVAGWVAQHMRALPGVANVPAEVDRLAADLTGDARAEGISGGDIHRAIGDLDDYLTGHYQALAAAA
jgi:hypothetical protein